MPPQDIINNVKRDVDPEHAYVNNQALPLKRGHTHRSFCFLYTNEEIFSWHI